MNLALLFPGSLFYIPNDLYVNFLYYMYTFCYTKMKNKSLNYFLASFTDWLAYSGMQIKLI